MNSIEKSMNVDGQMQSIELIFKRDEADDLMKNMMMESKENPSRLDESLKIA